LVEPPDSVDDVPVVLIVAVVEAAVNVEDVPVEPTTAVDVAVLPCMVSVEDIIVLLIVIVVVAVAGRRSLLDSVRKWV
jgi:hypothetical protein